MRRRLGVDLRLALLGAHGKGLAVELRQLRLAMDVESLFHQRPGHLVLGRTRPVGEARRDGSQLAVAVGLREFPGQAFPGQAVMPLRRAVTQHEMREIEVEFVRRHVGARHHEAHVAERAGVHDRLEVLRVHGVEFHRFRLVDQVEEPREGIAEFEAAAAAMTDVEDAAQFFVKLLEIIEVGIAPIDGMTDRSVQAAFGLGTRRVGTRHEGHASLLA